MDVIGIKEIKGRTVAGEGGGETLRGAADELVCAIGWMEEQRPPPPHTHTSSAPLAARTRTTVRSRSLWPGSWLYPKLIREKSKK